LPLSKFFTDIDKFRWLLGAREVCFTKKSHSIFFRLGKVVPIVRGDGVYQTTMNEILNELNKGDWLHIFSEGKINLNNEILGLRWGLGRLVADSNVTPIVIVLFHQGINRVLFI
jgi:monolysocardiolipin acyltransferase